MSSTNEGGNIGINEWTDDADADDDDGADEDVAEEITPVLMIAVILRCTTASSETEVPVHCAEFRSAIVLMTTATPPPRSIIRSNVSFYNMEGRKEGVEE